jgi:fatty acid kinase fatty acid binding subunit
MRIEIVTDSTSDIPAEVAEMYRIHIVPAILNIEGKSMEDGPGISRHEFYERLPHMQTLPTTSAPSTGSFHKIYEKVFQQGADRVLSLHAPAPLSGIYNAARLAAEDFGGRVLVDDSGSLTLGLGFQAMAASEAAHAGASLEEVLSHVTDVRKRIHLVAMLDTFEYVRRSGRVSWAKATLGALLNIKPFIGVKDGAVLRMGEARTRLKGIQRLADKLLSLGSLDRLAILHTNIEEEACQFLASLNMKLPVPALIVNVTTVIGTHVGPRGLGFVAVVH